MIDSRYKTKKKNSVIIIITVILSVAVLALAVYMIKRPGFELLLNYVTIEAGTVVDPYSYIVRVKNVSVNEILVDSTVSSNVPGIYSIDYSLGSDVKSISVNVVDTTGPEIVLKNGPFQYIAGDEIVVADMLESVNDISPIELSIDVADNDLSIPGEYTITVIATDLYGNRSLADVTLLIEAVEEETVFFGINDATILAGDGFDLLSGVSLAEDFADDADIDVDSGDYNANVPGIYSVTYSVTDIDGNIYTASRVITVMEQPKMEPEPVPSPAPTPALNAEAPTATPNISVSENVSVSSQFPTVTPNPGNVNNVTTNTGVVIKAKDGTDYTIPWDVTGITGQPYLVAVNRAMCTVTVYGKDEAGNYTNPVHAFRCSVGKEGHETPIGIYTTSSRFDWCYMVDGTWGRYAIRIDGGIMFHSVCYYSKSITDLEYDEFNKLGSPASLGCVRLNISDILWMYLNCPTGFKTVIYDDYTSPGPLGKPNAILIDTTDVLNRGWDPTDPSKPI